MLKWVKFLGTFAVVVLCTTPLMAQGDEAAAEASASSFAFTGLAAIGAGLAIIGGGLGIGKIGASACESMARQPELAAKIQTAMIIAAALIEGATFFALLVCMMNG